ncbi:hypothetical protein [Acinetobacter johnsonii]|uniref:hypothetical protein n=1 Tax=Acinetobacter johnsonii TaxID=40214 RepID=UPI003AF418CE
MASPKPYGLHVISGVLTDNDIERISSVIHRFLTFKEASQLDNLKQTYDLPDGGYFIVQEMGGVFRVLADKQEPEKFKFIHDGLVKEYIPMFFSGVVENAAVRRGEKVSIKITEQCKNRLERQLERKLAKTLELERFTILANNKFPEFVSSGEVTKYTQYFGQNPGWYRGNMAKVIQFVGGYGRQDFDQLPEDDLERISFTLPEKLRFELWEKYKDTRLPGYSGLPPVDGTFQYDYKWAKSHNVAFDHEGKPWLIQVDRKLWVMPLPIIPLTADPVFHEYIYNQVSDNELIAVLETFKAFPSGESFPEDPVEFQQWVRAGVIIEICDTADFHSHMAMFTACGWSFNSHGNAAYNTGYRYDDRGLIECSTFRLSLNLIGTDKHYGVDAVKLSDELNDSDKQLLGNYLTGITGGLRGDSSMARSLRFKLRNITQTELLDRARSYSGNASAEVSYWDDYQCQPIAAHTGRVHKLYTGKLYHPNKRANQPEIKFPEYSLGLCVSFDFTPLHSGVSANCDTIMYAYYDDDSLKVVKYFYREETFTKQVETDFEEYMTVGSWYMNETFGKSRIEGNFYLTDIDDRDEVAPTERYTTIKGMDQGYDSQPYFSFMHYFAMQGTLWRNRYYTHLTKTETTSNRSFELAILVPMFNTSCVVHARSGVTGQKDFGESLSLGAVTDPNFYRFWTYDFVFAWNTPLHKQTGVPYPKDGNPVWVEIHEYNPTEYSDFADNGPWITGLPADYTWLIHPNANIWQNDGGGGPPTVNEYSNSTRKDAESVGNLKWVVNDRIITLSTKAPESRYFRPSPDDLGYGMERTSSKVFLGDAKYANISETNESGFFKYTGYSNLVNHSKAYHFIGVINE